MLAALATIPLAESTAGHAQLAAPSQADNPGIVTPEQFGAVGDGVADDAPAIQRAMDAVVALGPGRTSGVVALHPRVAYRCGSGLVLDASHVSLWGSALLDFGGWSGRYLRVVASSISQPGKEAANNYGHKGMISGAIRLRGAGPNTESIGIDFDSPVVATAAQLLMENVAVSGCGVGLRFGARGYNNVLVRCEIFECGICIDWPRAIDSGERNSLIGCILFNAGIAVRLTNSEAILQLLGCSIDYTSALYHVQGGSILATSCHHESNRWDDRPIRCAGEGALVRLEGGFIANLAQDWAARNLVEVGESATVHLVATHPHNLLLKPVDLAHPTSWATGDGEFRMMDTQTFEFNPMPARLQTSRTLLSDPDFRSTSWEDLVWRIRDTATPITDRYGSDTGNLRLTKVVLGGETGLSVAKAYGSTASAAFVLIALPVSYGDAVLAGFRIRRNPARPGSDGTVYVTPTWCRIDGFDVNRIPTIVRSQEVGTLTVAPPTDAFLPVAPLASRKGRTAPPWATHFCMVIDLVKAHQASFVLNGLWADRI